MQKEQPIPNPSSAHLSHEHAALKRQQRKIKDDALKAGQGVLTVGYLPPQTIGDTLTPDTRENLHILAQLNALTKQLISDNEGIVENEPSIYPLPDNNHGTSTELLPTDFIFFPPGTSATTIIRGRGGESNKSLQKEQKEIISMMTYLVDRQGNNSVIVVSKNQQINEEQNGFHGYIAALLKNDQDEVVAFVADSPDQNNAIYIWRADVSDISDWTLVLQESKDKAKENGQTLAVYHTGEILERVLYYLEAPISQFEHEWLKRTVSK